jgi:hypothetical protein
LLAAWCLFAASGCSDRGAITPPTGGAGAAAERPERLARFVARALSDPAFRAFLKRSLDASPFGEHKLHLQDLLEAQGRLGLRALAAGAGATLDVIAAEARRAIPLEVYFPVAQHRTAWLGDEHVLVATALTDREPPVAFDTRGTRRLLSPDAPPDIPVLAVVPVETDFTRPPAPQACLTCGGGGIGYYPRPSAPTPGLYMTRSHIVDDFEGWLKGNPEFEVHILGQLGQTDSLTDYQCAGEHAGGPYAFDQNGKDWSGNVLLFSAAQLAAYNSAHPGQNVRVLLLEDDDTACEIRVGTDRLKELLDEIDWRYDRQTAGNDSSTTTQKAFRRGVAALSWVGKLAAWIKTNDDLVGTAIDDAVIGMHYPGYNWIVKSTSNATKGWIQLEMK